MKSVFDFQICDKVYEKSGYIFILARLLQICYNSTKLL